MTNHGHPTKPIIRPVPKPKPQPKPGKDYA